MTGPNKKQRDQMEGAHRTHLAHVVKEHGLTADERSAMTVMDSSEISAYAGYPEIQAQLLLERRGGQPTDTASFGHAALEARGDVPEIPSNIVEGMGME